MLDKFFKIAVIVIAVLAITLSSVYVISSMGLISVDTPIVSSNNWEVININENSSCYIYNKATGDIYAIEENYSRGRYEKVKVH